MGVIEGNPVFLAMVRFQVLEHLVSFSTILYSGREAFLNIHGCGTLFHFNYPFEPLTQDPDPSLKICWVQIIRRRVASISMAREEFMALEPWEELLPSDNRVREKSYIPWK